MRPWSLGLWPSPTPSAAGAPAAAARRRVVPAAASSSSAAARARDLWDYEGSHVSTIQLDSFKVFHRISFGHRNHRTYVVVVYDPASRACRSMEGEVERLATGLQHCASVSVARLNAADPDTRGFLSAAFNRLPERLPAVLLYPEAATGYVQLKGRHATAEDILRGINKLYGITLPYRTPLELRGLPELTASPALAQAATGAGPDQARELQRQQKREQFRQLLEEVAEAREAAAAAAVAGEGAAAGVAAAAPKRVASVASTSAGPGYWSKDKVALWGAIAALSVVAFAWDAGLSSVWDRWQLDRRQTKRARGMTYDRDQDLEDLGTILYDNLQEGRVITASGTAGVAAGSGSGGGGGNEVAGPGGAQNGKGPGEGARQQGVWGSGSSSSV